MKVCTRAPQNLATPLPRLTSGGNYWHASFYPGGNYGLASFYPGVTIVRGKNGLPHRYSLGTSWNDLPADVISASSLPVFQKRVKHICLISLLMHLSVSCTTWSFAYGRQVSTFIIILIHQWLSVISVYDLYTCVMWYLLLTSLFRNTRTCIIHCISYCQYLIVQDSHSCIYPALFSEVFLYFN